VVRAIHREAGGFPTNFFAVERGAETHQRVVGGIGGGLHLGIVQGGGVSSISSILGAIAVGVGVRVGGVGTISARTGLQAAIARDATCTWARARSSTWRGGSSKVVSNNRRHGIFW
jgi:hypothetical protein